MADFLTIDGRSALMSRVRRANTKPEIVVRQLAMSLGLHVRRNVRALPGSPDLVVRGDKAAIFVHGCFWHGHLHCRAGALPKTRVEYWSEKISRNQARDKSSERKLRSMGWRVLTIWECETKFPEKVRRRLERFTRTHSPSRP